jgi:glycosyltransferase involved in cell wall biosynthesis
MPDRLLVAIPAYNEEASIESVVNAVREEAPEFDVLVVNDGARDRTPEILRRLGVPTARHYSNLGYGRAVQTAIQYARRHGYTGLVTFDGDGQHRATDVNRLCRTFVEGDYDLLIGSRFMERRRYDSSEQIRRVGMWLFSRLVALVTGQRIYDTSSGFRVLHRRTFDLLIDHPFVDFHAEAIVLLLRMGYKVGEESVVTNERRAGLSMYGALSGLKYPLKTSLLVVLAIFGSRITDHENDPTKRIRI